MSWQGDDKIDCTPQAMREKQHAESEQKVEQIWRTPPSLPRRRDRNMGNRDEGDQAATRYPTVTRKAASRATVRTYL